MMFYFDNSHKDTNPELTGC